MKEGRLVLLAFGAAAVLMIALPVVTILTQTRSSPEAGMDGAISRLFRAADEKGPPSALPQPVEGIERLLPKGMPEKEVFAAFAASGFTCATDSNAATCFRSYGVSGCQADWKVRVIFSDNGTVWSNKADRKATCS
jgi:hypothetical protein